MSLLASNDKNVTGLSFSPTETQMEMWAPGATWQSRRTASTGSTARYLLARVRPSRTPRFRTLNTECRVKAAAWGQAVQVAGFHEAGEGRSHPVWGFLLLLLSFSEMGMPGSLRIPFPWWINSTRIFTSTQFPRAYSFMGRDGNNSSVASPGKVPCTFVNELFFFRMNKDSETKLWHYLLFGFNVLCSLKHDIQ